MVEFGVPLVVYLVVQALGIAIAYRLVEDGAADRARAYAMTFVALGVVAHSYTGSFGGAVAIQLFTVLLIATIVQVGARVFYVGVEPRR